MLFFASPHQSFTPIDVALRTWNLNVAVDSLAATATVVPTILHATLPHRQSRKVGERREDSKEGQDEVQEGGRRRRRQQ